VRRYLPFQSSLRDIEWLLFGRSVAVSYSPSGVKCGRNGSQLVRAIQCGLRESRQRCAASYIWRGGQSISAVPNSSSGS